MDWITYFVDLFLHLDKHLGGVISDYGVWTYLILLVVIFCETGLVVTPFLPGDSLLFAAGAFSAAGALDPWWLFLLLSVAAVAGDTVNYWIGAWIGPRAFRGNVRFLKKEYLDRTHAFYEKYGGKTIIIARFVPIVRTFAPFVAGVGAMSYGRFIVYNIVGGVAWVALFVFGGFLTVRYGGYLFGDPDFAKNHFSIIVAIIILISVMPMVVEYVRARREKSREKA
ncbi:MAG: DedA family protein [Planctomycetaceae bacterium]|nr:DedA family protein [Planctomycetaceae bacterium]